MPHRNPYAEVGFLVWFDALSVEEQRVALEELRAVVRELEAAILRGVIDGRCLAAHTLLDGESSVTSRYSFN